MNDEELLKFANEWLEYQPNGTLIWKKFRRSKAKAGSVAGTDNSLGYRVIKINNKPYKIHRINYLIHHGFIPGQIDHFNQIRNDNRVENLRAANGTQNQGNVSLRSDNKSGYRGVYWREDCQKWAAQGPKFIKGKWKRGILGYFDCPKEASDCFEKAADAYWGEFFSKRKE